MKKEDKIYVVIDTNVLVSSLFSSDGLSNPALVVQAVLNGTIVPLYNDEILQEYIEVLSRLKFKFSSSEIRDLISAFEEYGVASVCKAITDESFPDCDDIVFYEITMSLDGTYLVTGNLKHFPKKHFVVTPQQMVEILRREGLL